MGFQGNIMKCWQGYIQTLTSQKDLIFIRTILLLNNNKVYVLFYLNNALYKKFSRKKLSILMLSFLSNIFNDLARKSMLTVEVNQKYYKEGTGMNSVESSLNCYPLWVTLYIFM